MHSSKSLEVKRLLKDISSEIGEIFPFNLNEKRATIFDFSCQDEKLEKVDVGNPESFSQYISDEIGNQDARYGIGRYDEDRIIYRKSDLFKSKEESRTIHLGIDIWVEAGVEISTPLDSIVHSFQDNDAFGDYGPTLILEHFINGVKFWTLYGHLSRSSMSDWVVGKIFHKGDKVGTIGNYKENGGWPSHLHFEIITDLMGKSGDFPGVAAKSKKEFYLDVCPDPNLILKIRSLT
ncbi:peptidoglycan DD-metalloendopeptidase family protein [Candidatus Parcubacteria bacterium]|nr:peptidoglycan DD-metalloendopeptidase family protein [Patescibacteria group bacterium]MBU4309327.1 peptidoglycan DD-metalloendopeptidase family protein [Patescibacteria group bacterium]MBU4432304.1 peptidoglycan DD-metalloendopeptidase family protein [Patescibacteria group bacterium]MBU4577688.1 peptidoglycan DD-metalloendopeptidase family protein [Patescibacteria group bacterium]MCG2697374.1 peptidoglycan DD-metalloendopeptidase family protein [Candidatus Parcubacteria bacterium]